MRCGKNSKGGEIIEVIKNAFCKFRKSKMCFVYLNDGSRLVHGDEREMSLTVLDGLLGVYEE